MCLGGHTYRYQKDLSGGNTRWKCGNQSRQFRCLGYAVTRGVGAGCEIVNLGPHAATCEPGESKGEAKAIRHAVIDTAAGASGVTPTRAVAENLAGAGENVMQSLPDTHRLKRSAQNAAYRSRKRAQADNDGGVVPNYRSLEELVIPNKLLRRNDGDFLLFDSGPGEDRILLFGTASNLASLRNAEVWERTGRSKSAR